MLPSSNHIPLRNEFLPSTFLDQEVILPPQETETIADSSKSALEEPCLPMENLRSEPSHIDPGSTTACSSSSNFQSMRSSSTSPLLSPTSLSLIGNSTINQATKAAAQIPQAHVFNTVRESVARVCNLMTTRSQIEDALRSRTELLASHHMAIKKQINDLGESVTPILIERDAILTEVQTKAIDIQRDLTILRRQNTLLSKAKQTPTSSTSARQKSRRIGHPKANVSDLMKQIDYYENLRAELVNQKIKDISQEQISSKTSLERSIKQLDQRIQKLQKEVSSSHPNTLTDLIVKRSEEGSTAISALEKILDNLEMTALSTLDDESNKDNPILSSLTRKLEGISSGITYEADFVAGLALRLPDRFSDAYQTLSNEIALQFLEIGMWPPKPSELFNRFRQDILQTMLTIALTQHNPEFVGIMSSGGVYRVFCNVKTIDNEGICTYIKREIGCFKPDDEAPGGWYARKPNQPPEQGLETETASIRQALISQLASPTTTDSILATAAHPQFKYFAGEATIIEGDELRAMTPSEFVERNRAAMMSIALEQFPLPKQGVFIEWVHNGKSIYEHDYQSSEMELYTALLARIAAGQSDDTFYDRVFEDSAFLNWDPNIGNQLMTPSSEGSLNRSLTWRQIDMDKGLPSGFISGTSRTVWGSPIPDLTLPQLHVPLSENFSLLAKKHLTNVETTIIQCKNFWTEAIDERIQHLQKLPISPEDIASIISKLRSLPWTEAHSNLLRAAAVATKVAGELHKTPAELYNLIDNTRGSPVSAHTPKIKEDIALFYGVHNSKASKLVAELRKGTMMEENAELYEIPSKLAHVYLLAKAHAIKNSSMSPQSRGRRRIEKAKAIMMEMGEILQNRYWWKRNAYDRE